MQSDVSVTCHRHYLHKGFPTLFYFHAADRSVEAYEGNLNEQAIAEWVKQQHGLVDADSISRLVGFHAAAGPAAAGGGGVIDLLYDSECPICMMEVNFLRKRDTEGRVVFTDITSPSYRPNEHGNVQFIDGMSKLRAVLPNGNVIAGVEVFRQVYEAIGLGWVFWITKLPVIGALADAIYDIWAENRLRLTGRPELADVLRARAEALAMQADTAEEEDCDKCKL